MRPILAILTIIYLSFFSSSAMAAKIADKDWRDSVLGRGEVDTTTKLLAKTKAMLLTKASAVAREKLIGEAKGRIKSLIEDKLKDMPKTEREKLGQQILDHLRSEQGQLNSLVGKMMDGKGNDASEAFGGLLMRAVGEGTKGWADTGSASKKAIRGTFDKLFGAVDGIMAGADITGKLAGGDYEGAGKTAAKLIPWVGATHSAVVKATDLQKKAFRGLRDSHFNHVYEVWKKGGAVDKNAEEIKNLIIRSEGFFGDLKREKKLSDAATFKLLNKVFNARLKAELATKAKQVRDKSLLKWALKDQKNNLLVVPANLPASGPERDAILRGAYDNFVRRATKLKAQLAKEAGLKPGQVSRLDLNGLLRRRAIFQRAVRDGKYDEWGDLRKQFRKHRAELIKELKKLAKQKNPEKPTLAEADKPEEKENIAPVEPKDLIKHLQASHPELFKKTLPKWMGRELTEEINNVAKSSGKSVAEITRLLQDAARGKVKDLDKALADAENYPGLAWQIPILKKLKEAYDRSQQVKEARDFQRWGLVENDKEMLWARNRINNIRNQAKVFFQCVQEKIAGYKSDEQYIREIGAKFIQKTAVEEGKRNAEGKPKKAQYWKEQRKDTQEMLADMTFHSIWYNGPSSGGSNGCNILCTRKKREILRTRARDAVKMMADGTLSEVSCAGMYPYAQSRKGIRDAQKVFDRHNKLRAERTKKIKIAGLTATPFLELPKLNPAPKLPDRLKRK